MEVPSTYWQVENLTWDKRSTDNTCVTASIHAAGWEGTEIDRQFYFCRHPDYPLARDVHQAESLSTYLPWLLYATNNHIIIVTVIIITIIIIIIIINKLISLPLFQHRRVNLYQIHWRNQSFTASTNSLAINLHHLPQTRYQRHLVSQNQWSIYCVQSL